MISRLKNVIAFNESQRLFLKYINVEFLPISDLRFEATYEAFFKTEKWNKRWNASNENEFKIEGRDIKQIREEINLQRNQRGPN